MHHGLLGRLSERNIVMLGMGVFMLCALLWHQRVEFTYRRSTKPLPNQRLARVVFYAAGIVLIVGGLWGLWIEWYAGR